MKKAFTLIELLVVIAMIGILSSVVVANFSDTRGKTQASKIAHELGQITKAFQITSIKQDDFDGFPTENELGYGANPLLSTLINNGDLEYVTTESEPTGFGQGEYRYDNDGDVFTNLSDCTANNSYAGVNITVLDVGDDIEIVNSLDGYFDESDGLECGRVRTIEFAGITYMNFLLSDNQ